MTMRHTHLCDLCDHANRSYTFIWVDDIAFAWSIANTCSMFKKSNSVQSFSMTDILTPAAPLCSAPACGKRCVLSLRPERCGNKAENGKSKDAKESERGARTANRMMDEHRKTGEEKKRAQSGVVRARVMVTSDTRPSTAPAHTRAGRSDVTPLTPGTPGSSCSLINNDVCLIAPVWFICWQRSYTASGDQQVIKLGVCRKKEETNKRPKHDLLNKSLKKKSLLTSINETEPSTQGLSTHLSGNLNVCFFRRRL